MLTILPLPATRADQKKLHRAQLPHKPTNQHYNHFHSFTRLFIQFQRGEKKQKKKAKKPTDSPTIEIKQKKRSRHCREGGREGEAPPIFLKLDSEFPTIKLEQLDGVPCSPEFPSPEMGVQETPQQHNHPPPPFRDRRILYHIISLFPSWLYGEGESCMQ